MTEEQEYRDAQPVPHRAEGWSDTERIWHYD